MRGMGDVDSVELAPHTGRVGPPYKRPTLPTTVVGASAVSVFGACRLYPLPVVRDNAEKAASDLQPACGSNSPQTARDLPRGQSARTLATDTPAQRRRPRRPGPELRLAPAPQVAIAAGSPAFWRSAVGTAVASSSAELGLNWW
jgi:hypothetical protein